MFNLFARKKIYIIAIFETFYSKRSLAFDTGEPSSGDEKIKYAFLNKWIKVYYKFFHILNFKISKLKL